jgi:hypothetical protein
LILFWFFKTFRGIIVFFLVSLNSYDFMSLFERGSLK